MFTYLSLGLAWGFWAGILPGPLTAFLVSQSISTGWRRTLPATLAPLISDLPIIGFVFLLLTQLPGGFMSGVKIIGGLFILYLAYQGFKSSQKPINLADIPADAANQNVIKAALMNFLNPNPYIFWGVIVGPQVIEGWNESPIYALSFVGAFYLVMISFFVVWVMLAGRVSDLNPKVTQSISLFMAVALLLFGVWQLWEGVTEILPIQ